MTINWLPDFPSNSNNLTESILTALQNDIRSGKLRDQDRIPPQRELAQRLKVAIGTVTRAFRIAENRGIIYSDGRRGTFVGERPVKKAGLRALIQPHNEVIDLSVNYPLHSADPDLATALRAIAKDSDRQALLQYALPTGLEKHRMAGANWLKMMGLHVKPDRVIITAGAQHALSILFPAIMSPGDLVLTEDLTYPGLKSIGDQAGFKIQGIKCDAKGIVPDDLEQALRKTAVRALYLVPTLQSPTNRIMSHERKIQIARICQDKGIIIVEDEIHRGLIAKPPPLFATLAPEITCTISSVSKIIAGGLRLGFMVVPESFNARTIDGLHRSLLMVPSLTIEVFRRWLEDGTVRETIARRRLKAATLQKLANEILGAFELNAHPNSYFVWLILPPDWTSNEFCAQAMKAGVAVAPADTFNTGYSGIDDGVRISLSAPESQESLINGLNTLKKLLQAKRESFAISL